MGLDAMTATCCVLPVLVSLLAVRFVYVLWRSGQPLSGSPTAGLRCLIVLGSESWVTAKSPRLISHIVNILSLSCTSQCKIAHAQLWFLGGHTAEMMNVVTAVQKDRFTPRYYVAALTDNMSLQKAQVYEQSLIQSGEKTIKNAHFVQIYRSREVGQSYFTSIATTLLATLHAMWLVIRIRPQVIFCNGPGTCFPLCVCAFVLKVLGLGWSSIFYIESIARVKKLSLSGLLLYKLRIADQFFVQWPQLQQKYPRAYYAGRLM